MNEAGEVPASTQQPRQVEETWRPDSALVGSRLADNYFIGRVLVAISHLCSTKRVIEGAGIGNAAIVGGEYDDLRREQQDESRWIVGDTDRVL